MSQVIEVKFAKITKETLQSKEAPRATNLGKVHVLCFCYVS